MSLNNKRSLATILLVIILSLLSYFGSTSNEYNLDDNYYLSQVPKEDEDALSVFGKRFDNVDYRPLLIYSFVLEKAINPDLEPQISHGVNLALYIILCLIFYVFLSKLKPEVNYTLLLFTIVLFVLHPIHANVVNNLKSRDNLLSMLFLLSSLYFLVKFDLKNKKSIVYLITSLAIFMLAVVSKLDSAGLIFLAPLTVFISKKDWKGSLFVFVLFSLSLFIELSLIHHLVPIKSFAGSEVLSTENPLPANPSILDKISYAAITYFEYIKMILIPQKYFFYYGFNMIPFFPILSMVGVFTLLLNASIFIYSLIHFIKHRSIWSYGVLWFYTSLFYCSQLYTPVAGIVADRYAFIASAGGAIVISQLIYFGVFYILSQIKNFKNETKDKALERVMYSLLVIICIVLIPLNINRTKDWENIFTLIDADMPYLKNSYQANRIAVTHTLNKARSISSVNPAEAERYYAKSLEYAQNADRLSPDVVFILESKGMSYMGLRNYEAAEGVFHKINQMTDSSLISLQVEGDLLYGKRDFYGAAKLYKKILNTNYANDEDDFKYISSLSLAGVLDSAIIYSEKVIAKKPSETKGYEMKGFSYLLSNDTINASEQFLIAFSKGLQSDNIVKTFSMYYRSKNNIDKAMEFEKYLTRKPL